MFVLLLGLRAAATQALKAAVHFCAMLYKFR